MKVSPAALWHAKVLKIDPSLIRGSGPKGHVLKSDILFARQQQQQRPQMEKDLQLLIPCSFEDDLVSKGINKALSLCCLRSKPSFTFQRIPDYGIQIRLSVGDDSDSASKLQKLLPLLLKDPHYLLL